MAQPRKRSYNSDLRDQQARATRRQIVTAAGELFVAKGFAATTVDEIAAAAGVSRKTVFTAVGGKVQLLKLAYDFAMAQDDEPLTMAERPGLADVIAEPDDYRATELWAEFITDAAGRISGLYLALRGAAEVDAEAHELHQRWERERREAMEHGPVVRYVANGTLRDTVTPAEATDIMWLLVTPSTYHSFVVDQGWSPARFAEWVRDTVYLQLLKPRPSRAAVRAKRAAKR